MNVAIRTSAFKHGISAYAINICLLHIRAEIILGDAPEKRLFVGFDHNANPMEGDTLAVIHAMKLHKQFYHLLEEKNE
jgi:hypothetical protein